MIKRYILIIGRDKIQRHERAEVRIFEAIHTDCPWEHAKNHYAQGNRDMILYEDKWSGELEQILPPEKDSP